MEYNQKKQESSSTSSRQKNQKVKTDNEMEFIWNAIISSRTAVATGAGKKPQRVLTELVYLKNIQK